MTNAIENVRNLLVNRYTIGLAILGAAPCYLLAMVKASI